ncbi:MAG: LysR family transcriptional regulator, benzoate and cis,cis-muconate-responsive activator of ben, partial [Mycobacterium sp.]|nr:LysR family transcriptional regulator, benzoate and cis,cis-muconate-responsive activator of ben [Mycobacterium sp.]
MELGQLEYFVAVSRHGSLTRAAAQLRISQPALIRQIRQLEREVGAAGARRRRQHDPVGDAAHWKARRRARAPAAPPALVSTRIRDEPHGVAVRPGTEPAPTGPCPMAA